MAIAMRVDSSRACSPKKNLIPCAPKRSFLSVQESGALDRARALAQDYACRAKACLNGGPDSEYFSRPRDAPDFILEREN